jgi:sugar lactone lactonase YvrE
VRRVVTLSCMLMILLLPLSGRTQDIISTIVGGGTGLGTGTALTASLGTPRAVVADASGNLYVSSLNGEYVFKIDTLNNVTVLAGTGFAGFSGVGGPATSATLTAPTGLALDSSGNLLVADALNQHVYEVNLTTDILTNIAGSASPANPLGGFGGDGGPATQGLLNTPRSVAVSGTTIYIADSSNNRIRAVVNGTINTIAGNGTACSPSTAPCGDGGPPTAANLNSPSGVAVDALGNIFIADTLDNRIREISAATGTITTVAGTGTPCASPPSGCGDGGAATLANLTFPTAVIAAAFGDLYIADQGDQRIRFILGDTQSISTVAGDGIFGFSGDGGVATAAELSIPTGIFLDASGDIFIADTGNNRIREVTPANQTITTIVGGGSGGDGGAPLNANFAYAYDLALDAANNQFIIDFASSRIREVSSGTVTTVAGSGTAGYSGDGGNATGATLDYPRGIAVDAGGNLFIADADNQVIRSVQKSVISTYAGNATACSPPTAPCGDGGSATSASLNTPSGVAVDSSGNLFIADSGDNRIRKVDNTPSHIITTVAGTGNSCPVSTAACGDGAQATLATLSNPTGLAIDSVGNIFIADSGDNRIRRVDATTQVITTVAFNGQATFSGDGGLATLASMTAPNKVALDPAGNLYIGGGSDEVVRRVDATAKTVITVAGNAQQPLAFGFSGDGGPSTSATLANLGLAINATGGLYIADNNRIRFVQLASAAVSSPANVNFGNQPVGVPSTPVPVTLTNSGSDDLLVASIADANGFSQTNNCPIAPNPLAPGQSCAINITFSPTVAGSANDRLIITDNAAGSPQTIPLTGAGQAPFQLTTTCTSLTVVPGQSAIYTVDLAPAKGFTQSVSLSCSGAPVLATCTVAPSSMTLDGSTTIQAKVTATTTPATSGALQSPFGGPDRNRMMGLVSLTGMTGLAAFVILPFKRHVKARRLHGLIFLLCMFTTMATFSSCGTGGGDPPGTAAGTYPLTVTGTFKSAGGTAFTQNVSFNLVVQ